MDELDLFRDFRSGVATPSPDAERRAALRLTAAIEGGQGRGARVLRAIRKRPGRTALALAAVAGAAAAALFIASPWKSSPGFLERAQAALTPPPGSILHIKWDMMTTILTDPACRGTSSREIWIDQTPPYTYRALLPPGDPPAILPDQAKADPRELFCATVTSSNEFGGELNKERVLRFVPPNTLSIQPGRLYFELDPAAGLRNAMSQGRAHREGTTQLDGRTVERVRFDPSASCRPPRCPQGPAYGYFDPETLYPVALDFGTRKWPPVGEPVVRIRTLSRYLTYEYLPRTDDNLALTDIRAQHPNATGP
jgi:hypothetical protein